MYSKFFNLVLSALLLLPASIASALSDEGPAQFTGEWTGSGVYRHGNDQTYCSSFSMKFEGNRYLMNFIGGGRDCEKHREQFASVAMAHQDGALYINGQVVGHIHKNILEAYFSMPESDGLIRHWRMSMRREGNNMVYEESRRMDSEDTPLISFAGILARKN